MKAAIHPKDAEDRAGTAAPDSTPVARWGGPRSIYARLAGFRRGETTAYGGDSIVFPYVAIPDVSYGC